jgi:hypothetical protein
LSARQSGHTYCPGPAGRGTPAGCTDDGDDDDDDGDDDDGDDDDDDDDDSDDDDDDDYDDGGEGISFKRKTYQGKNNQKDDR